ncbi:hypothetical protein [Geodermatophilus marinus]|uniref:hypothetical protein n=1 Tax=Geodermatophilus sp. LHW52908 TaxID=2303986 RepID=UPI000E3D755D|nr:hypothetical protein [Geodermatophilus sp. LHW52908]RFU22465.1 hypothetical protein D0Z06_04215 [Geodermatophilus sp. LHW52908]
MRQLLPGAGLAVLALTACTSSLSGGAPLPAAAPAGVGAAAATPATAAATPDDTSSVTCSNPEGFTVALPADWSTNAAGVLPACSWFGPGPFEVPEASDVRTAPISFEVLPVPPAEAGDPGAAVVDSTEGTVDGRAAVREELRTGPGLWPTGTPVTQHRVDLGGGRTLVATAVGLPGTDHPRDVAVLDEMVASLELDGAGLA